MSVRGAEVGPLWSKCVFPCTYLHLVRCAGDAWSTRLRREGGRYVVGTEEGIACLFISTERELINEGQYTFAYCIAAHEQGPKSFPTRTHETVASVLAIVFQSVMSCWRRPALIPAGSPSAPETSQHDHLQRKRDVQYSLTPRMRSTCQHDRSRNPTSDAGPPFVSKNARLFSASDSPIAS
jgi:hypothetical protein